MAAREVGREAGQGGVRKAGKLAWLAGRPACPSACLRGQLAGRAGWLAGQAGRAGRLAGQASLSATANPGTPVQKASGSSEVCGTVSLPTGFAPTRCIMNRSRCFQDR